MSMHRETAFFLTFIATFVTAIVCAETRIEMLDGSTVNGKVVSFADGRYVITSPSLGKLEIDESEIRSIQPHGVKGEEVGYGAQIQSIQQQILANPRWVEMIMTLQSDPTLQAALNDPTFMHLIMSGDVEALKSDPRFLELLDNPTIQAVVSAVRAR
jgi:hypothetical protein